MDQIEYKILTLAHCWINTWTFFSKI